MKNLALILLASAFIFLLADAGFACSCLAPSSPAEELDKAAAVFSGKVIEVKKHKQTDDFFTTVEALIEVDKQWKGIDKSRVSVFTASNSAACGYNFQKGQSYLIYAGGDPKERLTTSICSRTRNLKDAGEDLKELGEGEEVKQNSSINSPAGKSEKGYLTVDKKTRIFYEKIGSGKQTVIIPLHLYLFDDFKHLTKNNRTLIFYDVRNRGASDPVEDTSKLTIHEDVRDLEKLRRHFKLKKFSLIGESYVGLMIVMYAMKYPQYVERLIQIGAVPLKFGTEYPKELTANDAAPVPDPAEIARIEELRRQNYHKTNPREFCEKDWQVTRTMLIGKPELAEKIASPCQHSNEWAESLDRHFTYHFVSVQKLDIPKSDVAQVKVPVLTIHGTKDRNAPYGAGREWAMMLPNARLLTIKGAAHLPWIDEPELFFSAVDTFLSGKFPKTAEQVK